MMTTESTQARAYEALGWHPRAESTRMAGRPEEPWA